MTHAIAFPTAPPSSVGVDAAGIHRFVEATERAGCDLHSLMIAREGKLIAQGHWSPYTADRVHLLYSCSKMFTATAVGLLVDAGELDLRDRVLEKLPWWLLKTDRSRIDPAWFDVTIAHCLSMTVGHDDDAWRRGTEGAFAADGKPADVDWIDLILRTRLDHEPGSTFAYNQVATYLLSRVVAHVSGEGLLPYLRPRLLDPLGIGPVITQTDAAGNALGFTGIHAATDALLKLAQLYLDEGVWRGDRILSADWVRRARVPFGPSNRDPQADPDWDQGYGFGLWCARHGYRGDGAFGQFAIVLPQRRTVVAMTAETVDMQRILDLLWEHVLPAIDRPGDPESDATLADRLSTLTLDIDEVDPFDAPAGEHRWARAELIGAQVDPYSGAGRFPEHWSDATVSVADGRTTVALEAPVGAFELTVTADTWTQTTWTFPHGASMPVLARGGWQTPTRFVADVIAIESPHRFRFVADAETGTFDLGWRLPPLTGTEPALLPPRT